MDGLGGGGDGVSHLTAVVTGVKGSAVAAMGVG